MAQQKVITLNGVVSIQHTSTRLLRQHPYVLTLGNFTRCIAQLPTALHSHTLQMHFSKHFEATKKTQKNDAPQNLNSS